MLGTGAVWSACCCRVFDHRSDHDHNLSAHLSTDLISPGTGDFLGRVHRCRVNLRLMPPRKMIQIIHRLRRWKVAEEPCQMDAIRSTADGIKILQSRDAAQDAGAAADSAPIQRRQGVGKCPGSNQSEALSQRLCPRTSGSPSLMITSSAPCVFSLSIPAGFRAAAVTVSLIALASRSAAVAKATGRATDQQHLSCFSPKSFCE